MNHLGDTNKMVSETPRTQAVWELFATDTTLEPDVEFSTLARQLERELNAANDRIKRLIRERDEARAERDEAAKVVEKALSELGQVARSRCALIDRIKRLEEAHSWRLIETAPSDYTWILGYDEKHGETGMIIFERGDESEPHWTDGMREWEPTHWMPLPEEPKAKEAKL
jgi:hypothetical protein